MRPEAGMEAPASLLKAKSLSRYYGTRAALVGFDDELQSGEIVFILGANGAGKSTLLAMLAGTLGTTSGEIFLNGEPLRRRTREQRKLIGYAAERPFLYGDLTVEESLELIASADTSACRVGELLEKFQLEKFRARKVRECSQGILRRAGLARAFTFRPKALLLDEPFSHLDSPGQEQLVSLLAAEREKGVGIYVAAHEAAPLRKLADRVIVLQDGRMRMETPRPEDALAYVSGEKLVGEK